MRRWLKVVVAGAVTALTMLSADPAAACSRTDGTIPGSEASVTTVSAGGKTFYVDDRDHADLDDDYEAGGIWIYEESNGQEGLQRGGMNWTLDESGVGHMRIPFSVVIDAVEDIKRRSPIPLFPGPGYYAGDPTVAEFLDAEDPCSDSATPDRLWF